MKQYHCKISYDKKADADVWLKRAVDEIRRDILPEMPDYPVTFTMTAPMIFGGSIAGTTLADPPAETAINPSFPYGVVSLLGTIVHEGIHAALTNAGRDVETGDGHHGPFMVRARTVGLVGLITATEPGPALTAQLRAIAERLGPIPGAYADAWREGKDGSVNYINGSATQCPIG